MLLFAGCSVFENEQLVPVEIEGEWTWYQTVGGWGQTVKADTVNYKMTLKIYSQNEAHWFKNDSLIQKYTIQEGDDDWTKDELVMFRQDYEGGTDCGLIIMYKPEQRELHLPTALCTDSPTYFFKR
jgi:hypothetical protein